MKIYTCKDRLEDIMTCIYDACADELLIGHDQIRLKIRILPDDLQTFYKERQAACTCRTNYNSLFHFFSHFSGSSSIKRAL